MIKNIIKQGLVSFLALLIISAFVGLAPVSAFASGNYGFGNTGTNVGYDGFNGTYPNQIYNNQIYGSNYNYGNGNINNFYPPQSPIKFSPITYGVYNNGPFCNGNCIDRSTVINGGGTNISRNIGW